MTDKDREEICKYLRVPPDTDVSKLELPEGGYASIRKPFTDEEWEFYTSPGLRNFLYRGWSK